MLTENERRRINQKIRGAFLPFRCAVEFWDYDAKLRFKVFDHNRNGIVEIPGIPVWQAKNENNLDGLLSQVRERVQNKGYELN